jgi:hypothetical protein
MGQAKTHNARRLGRPDRIRSGREHYGLWRGVQVTDAQLRVGDRTFDIGELRRLREKTGRAPLARRVVMAVAAGEAVIAGFVIAGLVQAGGWTVVLVVLATAQVLFTGAMTGLAVVRWPTPRELWAMHHDEPTLLYRDPDRYEFGKVRRAVERAMLARRLLK